jgi:branched-chain amino acid transport system permease protein
VGLAVGPFALKLRGLYLAIVTVGLVFLVQHTLLHTPGWTGRAGGIEVPAALWAHRNGGRNAGCVGC